MPWASVRDNVRLPLKLQHRSDDSVGREVDEALAMVGLNGFESAYPRELSGGMKMRVSIARALVTRPALLLMDEPFAALDEQTRMYLGEELSVLLATTNKTIVLVTHSLSEAVFLSDRVIVMSPRPGHIAAGITIDLPRPRRLSMREASSFGRYVAQIRETFQSFGLLKED